MEKDEYFFQILERVGSFRGAVYQRNSNTYQQTEYLYSIGGGETLFGGTIGLAE